VNAFAIGPHTRVTLHFALRLPSGEVLDSTFEGKPATFTFGDGNLPAGFEACLEGLRAGASETFEVPPEHAFGQPNPNNVQRFPRDNFGPELALEPGLVLSFADAAKSELPGVVSALEGDEVVVDFNHPLAGRTVSFEVSVITVEAVEEQ
jgi:FKBP-type peptidyl-prolyl cis-trans isomerase SlpA